MDNRIMRTVLFAAFAFLHMSAFGAGAARFGTLRNSDWVVTNAWQAVSNKTHDLILEIGHGDSLPPDWQNVSNAAMNAVQSLQPAYDYADNAITSFSSTGIVFRSFSYGTSNYWTDATGCVWEVGFSDWTISPSNYTGQTEWLAGEPISIEPTGIEDRWWQPVCAETVIGTPQGYENATSLSWKEIEDGYINITATRTVATNLVGRVALTNDIPDVAHSLTNTYDFATNVGLYTAVRDLILALGGSVTNFPTIGGGN